MPGNMHFFMAANNPDGGDLCACSCQLSAHFPSPLMDEAMLLILCDGICTTDADGYMIDDEKGGDGRRIVGRRHTNSICTGTMGFAAALDISISTFDAGR